MRCGALCKTLHRPGLDYVETALCTVTVLTRVVTCGETSAVDVTVRCSDIDEWTSVGISWQKVRSVCIGLSLSRPSRRPDSREWREAGGSDDSVGLDTLERSAGGIGERSLTSSHSQYNRRVLTCAGVWSTTDALFG